MAVQKPVAEAWFKATGKPIIEGYGLSETSPVLTLNPLDITGVHRHHRLAPARRPTSRSATTPTQTLPLGQPGEICIRGPQVMPGTGNGRTRPPAS